MKLSNNYPGQWLTFLIVKEGSLMHIMEGYLPAKHALAWTAASAPFVVYGTARLARVLKENQKPRCYWVFPVLSLLCYLP